MMQRIREKTAGWFAAAVIITIAIVFALWGVYGYLGVSAGEDSVVAKVNGHEIDKKTFMQAYQREQEALAQSQQKMDEAELKKRVLDSLMADALRLQDAEKNNFRVGRKLVDDFIATYPDLQQDGKFSVERFERFLAQINQTPSSYFKLVRDNLAQYYVQVAIAGSEFTLPFEAERDYAITDQKRALEYIVIPLESYLKQATVTDEQINAFYKEHEKKFMAPEKVKIEYAVLSSKDIMAQIKPSDEELKKYYDENHERFKQPEERKIQHILVALPAGASPEIEEEQRNKTDDLIKQIKEGADFGELAKKHSDDTASAEMGGDLGWLPHGAAVQPFDEAAFSAKQGEVVGPIKTPFGFHIIKVEEIKPEFVPEFAKVRDQVLTDFQQEHAMDEFNRKQEELSQLAFENPKSLDETAKKLNLTVKTSEPFTRQGHPSDQFASNPVVVEHAFSESVLAGNNSPVITLVPNEMVVVLRVAEHTPEKQLTVAEVKPEIENILKYEAASKVIKQKVQEMVASLKNGASLADLATKLNTSVVEANVGRFDFNKMDPGLLRYAFSLPRPSEQYNGIGDTQLANGNFAIVQLKRVEEGDLSKENKAMAEAFTKNVTQIKAQLDYELYVKGLFDNATKKYY
jgi:peptidyl-prolyl cis-trans isomerase D